MTQLEKVLPRPLEHIVIDELGNAKIKGTRMKVIHLVIAREAWGWTPEKIQEEYDHLTLADIYAAFSYYHDNKELLDRQIEEGDKLYEELRQKSLDSPIMKKLRAFKDKK